MYDCKTHEPFVTSWGTIIGPLAKNHAAWDKG